MRKQYVYLWSVVLSMMLTGCFSRSTVMTQESFSTVQVGAPISHVVDTMGEPYSIQEKNGVEEYTYIERVTAGNRLIYENHYTLFVQNGVVIGKTTKQEKVPAFNLIYQEDPNHNQYP